MTDTTVEQEIRREVLRRRQAEQEAARRREGEQRAAMIASATRKPVPDVATWSADHPPESGLFPDAYIPVVSGTRSVRNGVEVVLQPWEMTWSDTWRAVEVELFERAEVARRQEAGNGFAGTYRPFVTPFVGGLSIHEWLKWIGREFAGGAATLVEARNRAAQRGAWLQTRS